MEGKIRLSLLALGQKFNNFLTPTRKILLGFAGLITVGLILLSLPISTKSGQSMGFVNALFMATSSVCVTGLTVLDPGSSLTIFGQIVVLLLIQTGGLGFMTTTTMILLLAGKRISLRDRMTIQESLSENSLKGVVRMTRNILIFTLLFEGFGTLMLMTRFVPAMGAKGIYVAIFTSVSAFCNAGIDIMGLVSQPNSSLAAFSSDPVVLLTVATLIISGGLGFVVFADVLRKKKNKPLKLHTRVAITMSALLLISGTALFLGIEYKNPATYGDMSFGDKLLNAFFQATTTRTAGFSTINQAGLTEGSKMIAIISMFVGAAPASTGGGVKTTTIFVMLMLLLSVFRDEDEIVHGREKLSLKLTRKAGALVIFALFAVIAQALILWGLEGDNPNMTSFLDCVFESVSAFGTVGLSTGMTASLSVASKLTLCLTMFIGRLGPLTIGMAILRKARPGKPNIKYPDAQILIG